MVTSIVVLSLLLFASLYAGMVATLLQFAGKPALQRIRHRRG